MCVHLWLFFTPSELVVHECCHHVEFIVSQLASERSHAIAAIGDLAIDLFLCFELELAFTQAGNSQSLVHHLAFPLGPVADRAMLAEKRSLISFALNDRIALCFGAETGG